MPRCCHSNIYWYLVFQGQVIPELRVIKVVVIVYFIFLLKRNVNAFRMMAALLLIIVQLIFNAVFITYGLKHLADPV